VNRPARILGIACVVLALLVCIAVWDFAFSVPSINLLPVPAELISLRSFTGQALLADGRFAADYEPLTRNFEAQSRAAFCGVASSVVVLNALRSSVPRLNQTTFFSDAASAVRGPLRVSLAGMSLAQLADLLRTHGLEVSVFYAADTDVAAFRSIAQQNLASGGDFLLVNYQRASLGQAEAGHISPLAAYDAATDRLLILDVAAYKYPPVWVETAALWNAMNTADHASGRTRGFAVVREVASDPATARQGPATE